MRDDSHGGKRGTAHEERAGEDANGGILVVDDVADNVRVLASLLEERGYRVRPVTSGRAALRAVEHERPALILLDINMPDLDGYQVCEALAEHDEHREIPVIFISALSDSFDKVRAFQAGGVDYVTKPFQFDEVCARVGAHLTLGKLRRDLEERNRRLEESYARLRETEAMRDNLTHLLIHDLRSPLTGVISSLTLLREDLGQSLSPMHAGDIELALHAATKLVDMVTSVLDVSRLEAGVFPLELETHDLRDVIDEGLSTLAGLGKRWTLSFARPASPVPVRCDREVICRVMANLVANAISFTPPKGRIELDIRREGAAVVVSVTDTGPGVAPEHRERIFEKFAQVERKVDPRARSSGLGLTFCKLAVEAHGGRIGLDSPGRSGTTFWFTLPMP